MSSSCSTHIILDVGHDLSCLDKFVLILVSQLGELIEVLGGTNSRWNCYYNLLVVAIVDK